MDLECLNYWFLNVWSIVSRMLESLNLENWNHWISNVLNIGSRMFEVLNLECLKHWIWIVCSIGPRMFEALHLEWLKHCISNSWNIEFRRSRTWSRYKQFNSDLHLCVFEKFCSEGLASMMKMPLYSQIWVTSSCYFVSILVFKDSKAMYFSKLSWIRNQRE